MKVARLGHGASVPVESRQVCGHPDYPYASGTTRLLRDNFADLARESAAMLGPGKDDLVVRRRFYLAPTSEKKCLARQSPSPLERLLFLERVGQHRLSAGYGR
jgi:hypothetical protein